MKALHKNILDRLDQIINDTGKHIHDFIDDPHAFTRKRSLDAATVIKTTINMQGKDLTSELFRAFGQKAIKNNDKVVSTSAYVQRKGQLSPACFKPYLIRICLISSYLIINIVYLPSMGLILIKSGILNQRILLEISIIKESHIAKFMLMHSMTC
ncbi:hypothetical protein LAYK6_18290 [Lactobacillus amylovorus subsp. amylovorus]|nr:hypothetical protein LAYK6_18290 [Lactobacillus amylovorus]